MRESINAVNIAGTVQSIDIRHIARKDGKPGEYLAGTVVVKTSDKNDNACIVPVDFFTSQFKKDGTPSQIYTNLLGMENWNSIEAVGEASATKVDIRGAKISENLFVPQNSEEVMSSYKVTSNFFTKLNTNIENKNSFTLTGMVVSVTDEMKADKDGEMKETGRLIVMLATVGYNDKVEVIKTFVELKDAVDFIKTNWEPGMTVQCGGYFKYTTETVEKKVEMGFGEPEDRSYTKNIKEIIITKGSREPLAEDEGGFNPDDVKKGLAARKDLMAQTLTKSKEKKAIAHPADDSFGF